MPPQPEPLHVLCCLRPDRPPPPRREHQPHRQPPRLREDPAVAPGPVPHIDIRRRFPALQRCRRRLDLQLVRRAPRQRLPQARPTTRRPRRPVRPDRERGNVAAPLGRDADRRRVHLDRTRPLFLVHLRARLGCRRQQQRIEAISHHHVHERLGAVFAEAPLPKVAHLDRRYLSLDRFPDRQPHQLHRPRRHPASACLVTRVPRPLQHQRPQPQRRHLPGRRAPGRTAPDHDRIEVLRILHGQSLALQ